MSVARFIADQRTNYRVPHTLTCLLLGVSLSWFYKWLDRPVTPRQRRRTELDAAVAAMFDDAKGLHGSPRLHADLRVEGWLVSEKTVADSMRRQGLVARKVKRRRGLTKQDMAAPKFPDLLRRDFTASAPNLGWCGDITEIPTGDGKLYLATVIDLYSRRLLAAATSLRCDAELCSSGGRCRRRRAAGGPNLKLFDGWLSSGSAVLVQVKGWRRSFHPLMKVRILIIRSWTEPGCRRRRCSSSR